MQNETIYLPILNNIFTYEELVLAKRECSSVISGNFITDGGKKISSFSFLPEDRVQDVEFIRGLMDVLEKAPVLHVSLAFFPSAGFISRFGKAIKEISERLVFDFSYSPFILGGATFSFNGRYFDSSVRAAFSAYIDKNPQTLFVGGKKI